MNEIKLGDKVRCTITGFVGIATAKTEFINGCRQYTVAPKVGKGNKIEEEMMIDEQNIELVKKKKKKKIVSERVGGSMRKAIKMRGF